MLDINSIKLKEQISLGLGVQLIASRRRFYIRIAIGSMNR